MKKMRKVFNNNNELLALVKKSGTNKYIDFKYYDVVCDFDVDLEGVDIINAEYIKAWSIKASDIINTKDIKVNGNIEANDINAWDINAGGDIRANNINAWDIEAINIKANNINANNINAWDIKVYNDINAWDIKANDINAWNIYVDTDNINANVINYHAVCYAYKNILCKEIKGRVKNARHFCINGEIIIKK